jgi:hypothetical protein
MRNIVPVPRVPTHIPQFGKALFGILIITHIARFASLYSRLKAKEIRTEVCI